MEHGVIEREIDVEASPEVVFDVISKPEHVREWWPDDARFEAVAGAPGELVWRNADTGETTSVAMSVVEVDPPRRFSFRWCFADEEFGGGAADAGASLLVVFDLLPIDRGTRIQMRESGFREMGWEVAQLEEQYADHSSGWDMFIPRLGRYVDGLVAAP